MSKVSVVIPCFNLGAYLPEAVQSVRQQTFAPLELIIVDDGSTDAETLAVLDRFRQQEVTVYRTPNRGAPAARNFGIERAQGEYILCLDADDVLFPSYLEDMTPPLEQRPDVGIVTSHVEFFGNRQGLWQTLDYNPAALLRENCISSASLFRKRCWQQTGGYHDLPAFQDWDFWMSIVEAGWKWTVVPKPLYRYRVRSQSISAYGRVNRPQLLRSLIERHADSYREHMADILVAADKEIRRLRSQPADGPVASAGATAVATPAVSELDLARSRLEALDRQREQLSREVARWESLKRVEQCVREHVPEGSFVLVVSRGDERLLEHNQRRAEHFPQGKDGIYAGYYPANSSDAIAHLEELRLRGAEYLLFPAGAAWWLEHYQDLALHLELNYELVARLDDGGVLYGLAAHPERTVNRFSVVICTYRRAAFVGKAIESLFQQRYPKDKFEIIVVNNDSPDDTEQVIAPYQQRSPVPFTYLVEKRNGLSHARNAGIAQAQFEFVAHLDDDATACPNWLASFNNVINEHHALVVGGRVEKVFEEGFTPPAWFHFQYIQGFFGLNYREWGKKESVFRIRYPRYIGGGNSVYAKWLYRHFGGYDPRLGRDGKTLLAAEETYLNLVLDRHGVPIFYSDDAVIDHFIESSRVTRQHIRKKAYWSGISNAIMYQMFHDASVVRQKVRGSLLELKRLVSECLWSWGDSKNFSRRCRIINLLSFVTKYYGGRFRQLLGAKIYRPPPIAWEPSVRLRELEALPQGVDKYRELYHFYCAFDRTEEAREAYEQLRSYIPGPCIKQKPAISVSPAGSNRQYGELVERVRSAVDANLPVDARVIVVSKGDDRLLELDGRAAVHFPQLASGQYAGYYPADDQEAIEYLEEARAQGGDHLLFPSTSLWWLEHYPGLRRHLQDNYSSVFEEPQTCMIYRLDAPRLNLEQQADAVGVS